MGEFSGRTLEMMDDDEEVSMGRIRNDMRLSGLIGVKYFNGRKIHQIHSEIHVTVTGR